MVKEGFHFLMSSRGGKHMCEEFFEELEMRFLVKCCIEREDWTGAFEVVAAEFEFCHCVYIGDMELD